MDVHIDAPGGLKLAGIVEKAAGYSSLDGHPAPPQGLEPQQPYALHRSTIDSDYNVRLAKMMNCLWISQDHSLYPFQPREVG
jgi:hypothetical protein